MVSLWNRGQEPQTVDRRANRRWCGSSNATPVQWVEDYEQESDRGAGGTEARAPCSLTKLDYA